MGAEYTCAGSRGKEIEVFGDLSVRGILSWRMEMRLGEGGERGFEVILILEAGARGSGS